MDKLDLTRLQAKKFELSKIDVWTAVQSDHLEHQVGRITSDHHLGHEDEANDVYVTALLDRQ